MSVLNVKDIAITSLETITAFDLSGNYLFTIDELQNATISQTQEQQDITGRAGRLLNSIKRNKAVTVSGTNGLMSGGLLELQTGSDFANKSTQVMWTDYISAVVTADPASSTATTTYTATGTAGSEIDGLYKRNADGTLGAAFTQNSTAAKAGDFAYNPATGVITFYAGDVNNGDELVAFYHRTITADVLENHSDSFSKKCALYIDAFGEDKCSSNGVTYHIQFYIPRADFNGEFSFEMGDNQSVHAFEANALSGACGGVGGSFFTYTIFDNDEDSDKIGE